MVVCKSVAASSVLILKEQPNHARAATEASSFRYVTKIEKERTDVGRRELKKYCKGRKTS